MAGTIKDRFADGQSCQQPYTVAKPAGTMLGTNMSGNHAHRRKTKMRYWTGSTNEQCRWERRGRAANEVPIQGRLQCAPMWFLVAGQSVARNELDCGAERQIPSRVPCALSVSSLLPIALGTEAVVSAVCTSDRLLPCLAARPARGGTKSVTFCPTGKSLPTTFSSLLAAIAHFHRAFALFVMS